MAKKIGFFGGSFNPIHNGHLNVAISVKEMCNLDKVILCPSFHSPFNKKLAPALERLHMVKLGIEGIPGLEVSDLEIKRGGVSYTIDTLRELQKIYSGALIRLIISDELLERFLSWKEAETIIADFKPIVVRRSYLYKGEAILRGFEPIETPIMEISSTEIRERIAKNLPCQHLMPLACYKNYINLYS